MRRDLIDRIRNLEDRIARLEALGETGRAGTDQTIAGSHNRLDNVFGPGSLATQWYNRIAHPSSPDSHNAEMDGNPIGANGWAWSTAPSSINASSGYSLTLFPGWLYVYIYGSGTAQADLRCTDAGRLPRYKRVMVSTVPASTGFGFAFRSAVDANNYIEWLMNPSGISAWVCSGGTRTQVGSVYALPPCGMPVFLELGNLATGDYLTWSIGTNWAPGIATLQVTTVTGQRAANVQYVQLLLNQAQGAVFEKYFIDYVRFATS